MVFEGESDIKKALSEYLDILSRQVVWGELLPLSNQVLEPLVHSFIY